MTQAAQPAAAMQTHSIRSRVVSSLIPAGHPCPRGFGGLKIGWYPRSHWERAPSISLVPEESQVESQGGNKALMRIASEAQRTITFCSRILIQFQALTLTPLRAVITPRSPVRRRRCCENLQGERRKWGQRPCGRAKDTKRT